MILRRIALSFVATMIDVFSVLIALYLPSPNGWAAETDIKIVSVKVLRATPEYVDVEIAGSYDGAMGKLAMAATAKSKDGLVRSAGNIPIFFPVGQNVSLTVRIMAPHGAEAQRTDFLVAGFYKSETSVRFSRFLEWQHNWPEMQRRRQVEYRGSKLWLALYETLKEEDFHTLDALIDKWSAADEKDDDGESPLRGLNEAVTLFVQNRDWEDNLTRLQKWRKINPKSAGAAVVEALYWAKYASDARGSESSPNADPFAIKLSLERLRRAERVLVNSKGYATRSPIWYETYLQVANAGNRDDRFVENLFEAGIKHHPNYLPLYLAMMDRWLPIRSSKPNLQKLDEVVNKAIAATPEAEKLATYARLFAQFSYLQSDTWNFRGDIVSWPRMKESAEALVVRYPSAANLNMFAIFACQAGDKNVFLNIRPKIVNRVVTEMWPHNYSLDLCQRRFMQYG